MQSRCLEQMRHRVKRVGMATACLIVCFLFAGCGPSGPKSPNPNIVIITIDALRSDHLGAYGYERRTAPELRTLAARGARFDAATAQAPATIPSLFMIMTGELFYHSKIPIGFSTLAERLKAEGYETAAFVRNPLLEMNHRGMDRGFDTFFIHDPVSQKVTSGDNLRPFAERQLYEAHISAETLLAKADLWLQANHSREPFFLWIHVFEPHDPYSPPSPYDQQFDKDYEGTVDGDIRQTKYMDNPVWNLVEKNPPSEDRRHIIALYDGEIRYASAEIGKFLDKWTKIWPKERTIIVLSADHGESLGEHRLWSHGISLYQTELHIPLLMIMPGTIPAGTVISQPVETLDIVPTLLSLAHIEPDKHLIGRDLTPLFLGEKIQKTGAFARWGREYSYREGRWKLMLGKKPGIQLYDLEANPGEKRNLASERPQVLYHMRRALDKSARREIRINAEDKPLRNRLKALGYL